MGRRTRSAPRRSRRSGRRSNISRRRNGGRTIGRIFNNAPTVGRMPRDPPQINTTAERHYRIRLNVVYDKDSTADVLLTGNAVADMTAVLGKTAAAAPLMHFDVTRGMFFRMHAVRFGASTGVSIALKSVSFWGPLPATLDCCCSIQSEMGATMGRPPQVASDRSSGIHRAAVKLVTPQLFWFTNELASTNGEIAFVWDVSQSDGWDINKDYPMGVIDLSFVARAAP